MHTFKISAGELLIHLFILFTFKKTNIKKIYFEFVFNSLRSTRLNTQSLLKSPYTPIQVSFARVFSFRKKYQQNLVKLKREIVLVRILLFIASLAKAFIVDFGVKYN